MQHDEGSLKKISSQIYTRMLIAPTQSYVNYGFAVTMVELHCDEIDFGILMVCNVRGFFAKMPSVHYTPTPSNHDASNTLQIVCMYVMELRGVMRFLFSYFPPSYRA